MKALVYSKDNCPYCVRAKALLTRNNVVYEEVIVGKHILREDFMAEFPDQRTVPLIFVEGVQIGGYDKLVEYFKNENPKFLAG
jgi:glutaredoxin